MVKNLKSILELPQVVAHKLDKEILEIRISGPFDYLTFQNSHLSPLGLVPKKEPHSYCLIHHRFFFSPGFFFKCFQFNGKFYFDRCLPMVCSLFCFYFESFATFLEWVISVKSGSPFLIHYLFHFLFMGAANSMQCISLLKFFFEVCEEFRVSLAGEKQSGPQLVLNSWALQ